MSPPLPSFTLDGVLPPGDYVLTFSDLRASLLVSGPGSGQNPWDATWRHTLIGLCEALVQQLWAEGVTEVYLDGSFVEDKAHPNDIDGYFVCDALDLTDLQRRLNARDPYQCWTWDSRSRTFDPNSAKYQLPMWHFYRTELYPHFGQFSGIRGPTGYPLTFPDAFRQRRGEGLVKGILRIVP
ncbi:MAG: hypothetical protein FJZ01_15930 [Candidatus Sericytochromatia bacterium]|nr:hypothetical protein [Candidatus Tanganyikabacteria bacterium]